MSNPWGQAANAYGQEMDRLTQIQGQGMQQQAQLPMQLYQSFTQGYRDAQERKDKEAAQLMAQKQYERQQMLAEETLRHNQGTEKFAQDRLMQKDATDKLDRYMEYIEKQVDPMFTGDPRAVPVMIEQAKMAGIPEPIALKYFETRKIKTQGQAQEYDLGGNPTNTPDMVDSYQPGTKYALNKAKEDQTRWSEEAKDRDRKEDNAFQREEAARKERQMMAILATKGDNRSRMDPESVGELAKRLVSGLEPWPTGRVATDPDYKDALILARKLDPTFNADTSKVRTKTQQAFTTGKQADAVNAFNTALKHLERWEQNVAKIDNPNMAILGKGKVKMLREFNDPDVLAADADTNTLATEFERAYRLSGGTEEGIKKFRENLGSHLSKGGAKAIRKEMAELMGGKLEQNEAQYRAGTSGFGSLEMTTPETRKILEDSGYKTGGAKKPLDDLKDKAKGAGAKTPTFSYTDKKGITKDINDTPANRKWAAEGGLF